MTTTRGEGRSGSRSGSTTRAGRWLLAVGVAGAALAVGAVHTVSLCVVTVVIAAAAMLVWWPAEPMKARSAATILLLTGAVLTAYTALQCVPLPMSVLAAIAPHNADVWSRALAPLHEPGPSWAPLSLDPGATRVEVLKGVCYLLAFLAALGIARRRDGASFLAAAVVVTGLALALAALLHPAFGAHKLFGVYSPETPIAERHIAPLMNANNLAGYLNVAMCLALAAALAPQPRVPRPIAATAALVLAATQIWVASRGGVAAMVLGAVVVGLVAYLARTRHDGTVPRGALVTGTLLVVGTALFVLGGSDEATSELLDTDVSKLKMFLATARAFPVMPFFGSGRGAFESVFPAMRVDPGYVTYTHPENVVAQWLFEWGIPLGVLGLAAIAFALRPSVVLARSVTAAGAWAGIVALSVQNLGDLGTEVPGVVLAGVVCAAIVTAGTPGSASRGRIERWGRRPRVVAGLSGVAAVAALLGAAGVLGVELRDDQGAMRRAAVEHLQSADGERALARAAMRRHPAEPYLPFIAAVRAVRERDDDPIPWLGAALERAPVYGPAHLVLARVVAARSPSQARLEYRLAMEQAPNLVGDVMTEAPRVVGGYFDALELVPEGKAGAPVAELLVRSVGERLPATRVQLDEDFLARDAVAHGPASRLATDAVEDLEAGDAAPWCLGVARPACVQTALARATRLEQMEPQQCEGFGLHARARVASGDAVGGVAELAKAADEVADRVPCLEQLVGVARRAGNEQRVESALQAIVTAGCNDPRSCAENLVVVGQQYEATGRSHQALAFYRRALEQMPDDTLLAHVAALASGAGLHAESAEDYEQLARRHADDAQWARFAGGERDAALREAQRR